MEISSGKIQVFRTAHFYTYGKPGKHIKNFWMVAHGYGQLAKRFIRNFEVFSAEDTLILAPEGLSHFYWQGFNDKPVASWMTREHRLDEIADYSNYLSALYEAFVPQLHPDVKITLFGFSQGAATQCRWITTAFPHFHNLVLWAGRLPEDLDYQKHKAYFEDKKLYSARGTKDPFITPDKLKKQIAFIHQQGLKFKTITFDGKHEVKKEALLELYDMLREVGKK